MGQRGTGGEGKKGESRTGGEGEMRGGGKVIGFWELLGIFSRLVEVR